MDTNSEGVYSQLMELERRANKLVVDKINTANQRRKLESLKRTVAECTRKRDELRRRLERQKDEQSQDGVGVTMFKTKLEQMKSAYRLIGVSVTSINNDTYRVVYDTTYKGVYYEQYCLQLRHDDGVFVIDKHTIPPFIPISALEPKLRTDIREFMDDILRHLNAFVGRREEIVKAKVAGKKCIVGEIVASYAIDFVKLALRIPNSDNDTLDIEVTYRNIESSLPSNVMLILNSSLVRRVSKSRLVAWKTVLMKNGLCEAVVELSGQLAEIFLRGELSSGDDHSSN